MDLILWRHAEAAEAREGQDDLLRPLTAKGERQARRMGDWLNRHLPEGTRVLVSPALRAQQTAAALERKLRQHPSLASDSGVEALLHAVRWPDAREPVLVVGHQPTLGQTAAWLMGQARVSLPGEAEGEPWDGSPWTIRKGGVWWLRHQERQGQARVLLMSVRSPDQF